MMEQREEDYIGWLKEFNRESLPKVGMKNAILGELKQAGLPVPPAFYVTVDTFRDALRHNNAVDRIYEVISELDPDNAVSLNQAAQDIRELIESNGMPQVLEEWIRGRYEYLSLHHSGKAEMPVAIRPSAVAEGLPDAVFAGQLDAYLWVKGEGVIRTILRCWANLFSARAISYCMRTGLHYENISMSVCVQQMVNAKAAGFTFPLNLEDQDHPKIVIQGNWGLVERTASGAVSIDEWLVDKATLEIIKADIGIKRIKYVADQDTGKLSSIDVPSDRQNVACLTNDEVVEIAKTGKKIEGHFGTVKKIEWAVDKASNFPKNIFILQCDAGAA